MTYSIVARDPSSGELGVAVQSHYFGVGPVVPWGRPGVGVVATQASVQISHGPDGVERMAGGMSASEALESCLSGDANSAVRQVAMVDASGRVAVHTGSSCIACAGDVQGDQFCVQANMMARPGVPEAMALAFTNAPGRLAERMLASMQAAELAGGDIRGRQSAALVVFGPDGQPWERLMDLRVDDNPEPLVELERLLGVKRAYESMDAEGRPDLPELTFWRGIQAAVTGDLEAARKDLEAVYGRHEGWRELVRRLPAAGIVSQNIADDLA